MRPATARRPLLLAVLLGALALAACDNAVDPFADDPPAYFSLAGVLDADADTQFVRVEPLRRTLGRPEEPLGLSVVSTSDDGEAPVAWRDSLVRLDDGTLGHLYWVPLRPEPGVRYTLTVDGGDRRARAATTVPAPLPIEVGAVVDTFGTELRQRVTWAGLRQAPERIVVRYLVRPPDAAAGAPPDTVAFSYVPVGTSTERGLAFDVNLTRDRAFLLTRLDLPTTDSSVALAAVTMTIRRLSDEWFATGDDGIEGGFGFFGSASTISASWTLDPSEAARVGYRVGR